MTQVSLICLDYTRDGLRPVCGTGRGQPRLCLRESEEYLALTDVDAYG